MVAIHFEYLETEFGFIKKSSKQPFVIYDGFIFRILIYYDINGTHELDLGIRQIKDNPSTIPSKGLCELAKLHGGPTDEDYQLSYPKTPEALHGQVRRLSETLKKYGSEILTEMNNHPQANQSTGDATMPEQAK